MNTKRYVIQFRYMKSNFDAMAHFRSQGEAENALKIYRSDNLNGNYKFRLVEIVTREIKVK